MRNAEYYIECITIHLFVKIWAFSKAIIEPPPSPHASWLKNVVLKRFSSATGEPAVCNTQITHVRYAKYICGCCQSRQQSIVSANIIYNGRYCMDATTEIQTILECTVRKPSPSRLIQYYVFTWHLGSKLIWFRVGSFKEPTSLCSSCRYVTGVFPPLAASPASRHLSANLHLHTSSGLWLALGQVVLGDMRDFTVLISCLFLTCVQSPFSQIIYLLSVLANKPFDISTWLVSCWTDLLPSATMRLRTLLCKINQRDFTQLIVLRLDRCQLSDTFTFIWRLLQELT